eukprot:TRINITY_DN20871_c0_g1_i1.p1 TRINITY_DN20871_c0_g1~~TRINITY_DN20871_c0_g1_i1.p1  ORF type:complete len:472 (+),score=93.58 TRINITY_DN20871_c0_g1_i1:88-1503(+)
MALGHPQPCSMDSSGKCHFNKSLIIVTMAFFVTIATATELELSSECIDADPVHAPRTRDQGPVDKIRHEIHRPDFTPFAAIDAASTLKLSAPEPHTEAQCQEAVMSDHVHDAYHFDHTSKVCSLITTPLHRYAHLATAEPWSLAPDSKPIVIQMKPERASRQLLQALTHFAADAEVTPSDKKYRMLNNMVDVTNTVSHCSRHSNNTIVVIIADSSQERYMRIWLNYWYKSGGLFSQVLYIAQDIAFYDTMERLLPGQVLLEPNVLEADSGFTSQVSVFRSFDFARKISRRYYQLSLIAATGVSLLYSDIDVLNLCNPLQDFAKCDKMRAAFDDRPNVLCSGYIYVPGGNHAAMRLLLTADASFIAYTQSRGMDQLYFNFASFLHPGVMLPLKPDRFPTARHAWKPVLASGIESVEGKICYLHNNYAAAPKKVERLKQSGIIDHVVKDNHPGFLVARDGVRVDESPIQDVEL